MSARDARFSIYRATRWLFPARYRARVVAVAAIAPASLLLLLGAGLARAGVDATGVALWLGGGALVAAGGLAALHQLLRPIAQLSQSLAHVMPGEAGGRAEGDEMARIARGVEALGRKLEVATRRADPARLDDPLTGLGNRLSVMRRARDEIVRCRRKGAPLSVGLFEVRDLDAFRAQAGELAADEALRRAAEALAQGLRAYDVLGRWEGAIFVAMMPEAEIEHAVGAMRRARELVEQAEVGEIDGAPISAVAGVAVLHPEDATLADIAARAARALARARAGFGGGIEAAPGPRTRPAHIGAV